MTLNDLKLNEFGKITNIYCNKSIKQRLYDLGLVQGTIISPIFKSALGDPIAYEFRGNIVAIRSNESNKINIKKV